MEKVCDKHSETPVKIYDQCVGCEIESLREHLEHLKSVHEVTVNHREELLEQLGSVKEQRDRTLMDWGSTMDAGDSLIETIEAMRAELAAKDKVLEWYADDETYEVRGSQGFRDDIYVFKDKGERARSILSQFAKASTEASHG